jgi:hypothetical protein
MGTTTKGKRLSLIQRPLLLLGMVMAIVLAAPALRIIVRSEKGSGLGDSANVAPRKTMSPLTAHLSLPDRLAATYLEYLDEMQALQTREEEGGDWIMPEECRDLVRNVASRHTFYSELGQDLFLYKHFFRSSQDQNGRKRFFLDIGEDRNMHG